MPSLSNVFDPNVGPLLRVAMAPPGWQDGGQLVVFDALVDTGASTTCIAPAVATALGLPILGMRSMASATHSAVAVPLYICDLIIPFSGTTHYIARGLQVLEFAPPATFQALLGRDVICRGALAMSSDCHMTFSI